MNVSASLRARPGLVVIDHAIIASALLPVLLLGLMELPGFARLNSDTLWLVHAAEQMLAGKALYRDIVETNPPMSALLYLPPVAAALVLGLPSEAAVAVHTLACAAIFTGVSIRLLAASGWYRQDQIRLMGLGLFIIMALMPKHVATQREHFAAMAALPFALLVSLRIGQIPVPNRVLAIAAAACGGLCMCIKPHFALALAMPVLHAVGTARSFRPLFVMENIVAGGMLAAFWLWTWIVFPDYFAQVLPLLVDAYVPLRIPVAEYAIAPLSTVFYLLLLAAAPALLQPLAQGPATTVLWCSIGFFMAYLIQGKGWSYHLSPAIQLLGAAVLLAQFPRGTSAAESAGRKVTRFASLILLSAALAMLFAKAPPEHGRLRAVLSDVPKPAAALIVTEYHSLIFPALTDGGLAWASRTNGTWLAETALRQLQATGTITPERQARLVAAVETLRRWLREDLAASEPAIVIFDTAKFMDWERFAFEDPAFASLMKSYRRVESFHEAGGHHLVIYRRHASPPE
jgi:hypothetical protein